MKTYEKGTAAEFGKRLARELERKNGGNQSELARFAGCSPQAVNKWLSGQQFPRDKTLRKVAEYVNVTPEYLRFGTQIAPPTPPQPQYLLVYVRVDEAELLTHFRELSETGKRQFHASLQAAERMPQEDLPKKSSGSN